jgi:uncharacterized membrane protein
MARQHPALVHLPIGFLLFGGLLALARRWRKEARPGTVEQSALLLGGWGGVAAAAAGSWLIQLGGYPTEALFWHRAFGFVIPLAAAGTLLLSLEDWPRPFQGAAWTILVGSLFLGGHLGGEMTHGKAFTSEYAPGILRPIFGEPPSLETRFDLSRPDSITVYKAIVDPIFVAKCTSCHGDGRRKGGLDLMTADAIAAHETDTEDDALITWGASEASLLIQRITLPAEHRRAMPPAPDAKPLSYTDIELLKWWVDSESGFDGTIASADIPSDIRSILSAYGMDDIQTGVFALDVADPDTAMVSILNAAGLRLTPVSRDQPFLDLACDMAACLTRDGLEGLAENIISVDLSGSDATDGDLAELAGFPHLTSIDLSRTSVVGSGLEALAGLDFLTRVNLYGTQLTDTGLEHLAGMASLESVYLWETDVTEEGVARLRDALENAEVNDGR